MTLKFFHLPIYISVLLWSGAFFTVALSSGCKADNNDSSVMRERIPPEPVAPVEHEGIRYEVIHWGKARGLSQNGGYVAALDQKTGQELWLLRVYEVNYGDDIEADRQDVFITSVRMMGDSKKLLVEDENGRCFTIDLATRTVNAITASQCK